MQPARSPLLFKDDCLHVFLLAKVRNKMSAPHLISISLKVVSMAQVFWASFSRWAIRWRILFIFTWKWKRNKQRLPQVHPRGKTRKKQKKPFLLAGWPLKWLRFSPQVSLKNEHSKLRSRSHSGAAHLTKSSTEMQNWNASQQNCFWPVRFSETPSTVKFPAWS